MERPDQKVKHGTISHSIFLVRPALAALLPVDSGPARNLFVYSTKLLLLFVHRLLMNSADLLGRHSHQLIRKWHESTIPAENVSRSPRGIVSSRTMASLSSSL